MNENSRYLEKVEGLRVVGFWKLAEDCKIVPPHHFFNCWFIIQSLLFSWRSFPYIIFLSCWLMIWSVLFICPALFSFPHLALWFHSLLLLLCQLEVSLLFLMPSLTPSVKRTLSWERIGLIYVPWMVSHCSLSSFLFTPLVICCSCNCIHSLTVSTVALSPYFLPECFALPSGSSFLFFRHLSHLYFFSFLMSALSLCFTCFAHVVPASYNVHGDMHTESCANDTYISNNKSNTNVNDIIECTPSTSSFPPRNNHGQHSWYETKSKPFPKLKNAKIHQIHEQHGHKYITEIDCNCSLAPFPPLSP